MQWTVVDATPQQLFLAQCEDVIQTLFQPVWISDLFKEEFLKLDERHNRFPFTGKWLQPKMAATVWLI